MFKIIILALILLLFWYFFIKKYDYEVTFNIAYNQPSLYFKLLDLKRWEIDAAQKDIEIVEKTPYRQLKHQVGTAKEPYLLEWSFKKIDTNLTKVQVGIIGQNSSWKNKWDVLLRNKKFEQKFIKRVAQVKLDLETYLKTFQVELVSPDSLPSQHYAYIEMSGIVSQKAEMMMDAVFNINHFLIDHNIELLEHPFVSVEAWDIKEHFMRFRFCFPIPPQDTFPQHPTIKLDSIEIKNAYKANYYGNYSTSYEAWLALYNTHAKENETGQWKPVEIFLNNPHQGGNDLEWKADVYLTRSHLQ